MSTAFSTALAMSIAFSTGIAMTIAFSTALARCTNVSQTHLGPVPSARVSGVGNYKYIPMREKLNRCKWIHVRLTEEELAQLKRDCNKTSCQALSEFARLMLLGKPVTILHRNQSADELVAELMLLRNELSAIGRNYNQVVRKMHTLKDVQEVRGWLLMHEQSAGVLMRTLQQTRTRLTEINEKWLPS